MINLFSIVIARKRLNPKVGKRGGKEGWRREELLLVIFNGEGGSFFTISFIIIGGREGFLLVIFMGREGGRDFCLLVYYCRGTGKGPLLIIFI